MADAQEDRGDGQRTWKLGRPKGTKSWHIIPPGVTEHLLASPVDWEFVTVVAVSPRVTVTHGSGGGGPSNKATRAGDSAVRQTKEKYGGFPTPITLSDAVLAAAHDPALGLDRSVCLRDVVEWLESWETHNDAGERLASWPPDQVARQIERKFAEGDRGQR